MITAQTICSGTAPATLTSVTDGFGSGTISYGGWRRFFIVGSATYHHHLFLATKS
jgi:hypothetical protein